MTLVLLLLVTTNICFADHFDTYLVLKAHLCPQGTVTLETLDPWCGKANQERKLAASSFGGKRRGFSGTYVSRVLVERESSMLGKLAWPHAPKGQSYPRELLPMEQTSARPQVGRRAQRGQLPPRCSPKSPFHASCPSSSDPRRRWSAGRSPGLLGWSQYVFWMPCVYAFPFEDCLGKANSHGSNKHFAFSSLAKSNL